ncbi:hypothetical protein TNCV_4344321 [Trichonephila clavipes]|nr:hypothetical protein TNCV_4344321 [Trichonephila clavipes]
MQISVERIRTTYPKQTLLSKLLKQKTHKVSTLEHRGRQRLWCTERQSWVQELPYVVLSGEFGSESIILMAIYMSGGSEETARHLPVFDICIGALHLDAERLAYHSCPATTGDEVGHKLEATWNALLVSAIQGQIDYMPNRLLWSRTRGRCVSDQALGPMKTHCVEGLMLIKSVEAQTLSRGVVWKLGVGMRA